MSDRRKAELAVREAEKDKKLSKRRRGGDCGLAGRRKRKALGSSAPESIQYVFFRPAWPRDKSLAGSIRTLTESYVRACR